MEKIRVELGLHSYDILIGQGVLPFAGELCQKLHIGPKIVILTNPEIATLYLQPVKSSLAKAGFTIETIIVPAGEEQKNLKVVADCHEKLSLMGLDRKSTLLALGGGVIGDLTGFLAATYLRGINFIQMPTTLLAQVDSSVGGKTGVNLPAGKNLVGCFYQPKLVLIDVDTLKTLPDREFKTGMAEVIKYGMISSEPLFKELEANKLDNQHHLLPEIIAECCQIKADVVGKDERESYLRMILNYGHTAGHAIEAVTKYKKYTHGEAVALGMIAAGQIAIELNLFSAKEQDRQIKLIKNNGLPVKFHGFDIDELLAAMHHDKKAQNAKLTFVLPQEIGEVEIDRDVPEKIVKAALGKLIG
ncbi:MAG: 3-dehydroquinate synthase [Candidatus Margulisiibacteriota bacterium]